MEKILKRLKPTALKAVSLVSFVSGPTESIEQYEEAVSSARSITPLIEVIKFAMTKYENNPRESDGWLAPRVHAALRLSRREAGDIGIWHYLSIAVQEIRSYITWRWGREDGAISEERVASFRRNALSVLWWIAEFTRNGSDYSLTEKAFSNQDIIVQLTDLNFAHNRPAALAYVIALTQEGRKPSKNEAQKLAKDLNHRLSTIVLDALAPDAGPYMPSVEAWINEEPDETMMLSRLPEGPDEPKVPEESIQLVMELMAEILNDIAEEKTSSARDKDIRDESDHVYISPDIPAPLENVVLSFLDRQGRVPAKSGLNWGQRAGRDPNQAYIPIPAEVHRANADFFPERGEPFKIITDDGQEFTAVVAQDNSKALETPEDNGILGRYFRQRIGLPLGELVEAEDLLKYGRTDVKIIKVKDGLFQMDFSAPKADPAEEAFYI